MYDSRLRTPIDSHAPYWIDLGRGHILRFPTYRIAYPHSYRNGFPPIWFDDDEGTHLCQHVNGQERYKGNDPTMQAAEKWARLSAA